MKMVLALLLGGLMTPLPVGLASDACLRPPTAAAIRTVGGVTLIDGNTLHWRGGLPAGLPAAIAKAPWFRADAYAHASARDDGTVDLIQSTLLQGNGRPSYRTLRRLHVLCGREPRRGVCLEIGFGGASYFVDRRSGTPARVDVAGRVPIPAITPLVLYVVARKDALFVATIARGPRRNPDRDVYLVHPQTGMIRVQCSCRAGRCDPQ